MDEQPLAKSLLELLLTRLAGTATKDQLRPQLPLERDAPVLSGLLVDDGVVVLQVGAEALGLERNPQRVLVHGVGVLAPVAEVVGVQGEGLAQVLDWLGRFVEEDLSAHVSLAVCGLQRGIREHDMVRDVVGLASCVPVVGLVLCSLVGPSVDCIVAPPHPRDGKGAAVTYRSVGGPEAVDLLLGAVERALGSERLEDLDNVVPELLVVLVEQDNDASRLRVEGRGDVEEGLLGELLDLRVRDGRLLVELVVCAALLDGLKDVLGKLS